jgi:hypothetical protein
VRAAGFERKRRRREREAAEKAEAAQDAVERDAKRAELRENLNTAISAVGPRRTPGREDAVAAWLRT